MVNTVMLNSNAIRVYMGFIKATIRDLGAHFSLGLVC